MKCPECGYETIWFGELLDPCIACGYMRGIEFYGEASSEIINIRNDWNSMKGVMTKQEEIREGLEDRIKLAYILHRKFIETGKLPQGFRTDYELAHDIVQYLHSQGVVIKVDRELPENIVHYEKGNIKSISHEAMLCAQTQQDMAKAGYVAVEPLIKEIE